MGGCGECVKKTERIGRCLGRVVDKKRYVAEGAQGESSDRMNELERA